MEFESVHAPLNKLAIDDVDCLPACCLHRCNMLIKVSHVVQQCWLHEEGSVSLSMVLQHVVHACNRVKFTDLHHCSQEEPQQSDTVRTIMFCVTARTSP